jgi:TM2 domain-containing membrane protein YozV
MNQQPYAFVSYAHKDSKEVLPCINAMQQSGIRVWYDEGIEAGSEWPEFIAEKVMHCTKFILFVTNAYLASQNCKRELNYAISRNKDILTIFLKEVSLTPGMEMQLGPYQAFFRNRFSSDILFYNTLCREHYFDVCRTPAAYTYTPQPAPQPASPPVYTPAPKAVSTTAPRKSRIIAFLLSLYFGIFGLQKFYLGQPKKGIRYLIFFFTAVPFYLSLYEGFVILFSSKEKLFEKYGYHFTW